MPATDSQMAYRTKADFVHAAAHRQWDQSILMPFWARSDLGMTPSRKLAEHVTKPTGSARLLARAL